MTEDADGTPAARLRALGCTVEPTFCHEPHHGFHEYEIHMKRGHHLIPPLLRAARSLPHSNVMRGAWWITVTAGTAEAAAADLTALADAAEQHHDSTEPCPLPTPWGRD